MSQAMTSTLGSWSKIKKTREVGHDWYQGMTSCKHMSNWARNV